LIKIGLEGKANTPTGHPLVIEGPGTKIGNYELLELIGEGGMGLVYLAQQQEPKRKVALKIVKLGMGTRQVVARFETERQTLALLAHPNIAHVFDAGTTETGRPYFVMEHVQGRSITKYCDEEKLSVEQRLELFQQICEGVHHAHQKGIIHRDLKPSNILVSVHGDRAVPKIIDFGIAKAVTQPLTERTSFTEHGQLLGTPEYMSPEQAEMAYQDVDTRSDIYSLGVLLYELLAGATPFDAKRLRKGGIDHIQQVICEEEPRTPSARLTSLGDKAEAVAQRRRTQIITLTRRLHRELEWIPMKAMRKDRTRRYRSASELSDDIQNYLTGAPLIAGPESNVYRARKFVRKHAGFVASAALVALVIVIGLVTSTAFSFSAEKARGEEAAARVEAEQAQAQAEQSREKEVTARTQVERALKRAENAEQVAQEQADRYRNLSYVHGVALADAKYRDGNLRNARQLLNSCPDDLRHWEWHRLNYIMDESVITFGRKGVVLAVAFSPDDRFIASSFSDITIWDATTGKEIRTLKGHDNAVLSLAFSPDGKRIISGSMGNDLIVWDVNSGEELMRLEGHDAPKGIASVDLSTDGKQIVSGDYGGTIKIWEASSGKELLTIRTILEDGEFIRSVAFSPDGKRIVAGQNSKRFYEWDAKTGEILRSLSMEDQPVLIAEYSPDNKRIALGCNRGMIKIVDPETGEESILTDGKGWQQSLIQSLAFSPDGRLLVSGGYDHVVRVWDTNTGRELTTLTGHSAPINDVVFSSDGQRIASGALEGKARIWDLDLDREQVILSGHKDGTWELAFSPDGRRLVSASGDKTVKVWNVSTAKEIMTLSGHEDQVLAVAFSPDGKHIASGGKDEAIRIWDAASGAEARIISGNIGWISSVAFSPDGKQIASSGLDSGSPVKVWNTFTGDELLTLEGHENGAHSVAFNAQGTRIVTGGSGKNGAIKIWDASTGEELKTMSGQKRLVRSVVFTPDGRRIVSGSYDGTVRVWDAKTGDELMKLIGHKKNVDAVSVSPDGKRIASGSFISAKVWDAETGAELMTLPSDGAMGIAFSPDGKTIAGTGGPQEGDVSLWQSGPRPDVAGVD
jgi:WD40 repeat protein